MQPLELKETLEKNKIIATKLDSAALPKIRILPASPCPGNVEMKIRNQATIDTLLTRQYREVCSRVDRHCVRISLAQILDHFDYELGSPESYMASISELFDQELAHGAFDVRNCTLVSVIQKFETRYPTIIAKSLTLNEDGRYAIGNNLVSPHFPVVYTKSERPINLLNFLNQPITVFSHAQFGLKSHAYTPGNPTTEQTNKLFEEMKYLPVGVLEWSCR